MELFLISLCSIPVEQVEAAFNENRNMIYSSRYTWSYDLSDWIGDWKRETRYNTYGDYYLDAYYEWDSIYSDWNVKSGIRWDRYYDIENHEIESLGYNWKQEVLDWVPGEA